MTNAKIAKIPIPNYEKLLDFYGTLPTNVDTYIDK